MNRPIVELQPEVIRSKWESNSAYVCKDELYLFLRNGIIEIPADVLQKPKLQTALPEPDKKSCTEFWEDYFE